MSSKMKWKLVPVEPMPEQLKAGQGAWLADPLRLSSTLYRAMLAAAPEPPAPAGEVVAPVGKLRSAAIQAAYHFAYVASREESVHVRSDAYARADQAVIDAICRLASAASPPTVSPDAVRRAALEEGWSVVYDNDTGPDDEYFVEWWAVLRPDGAVLCRCDSQEDADAIRSACAAGALATQPSPDGRG